MRNKLKYAIVNIAHNYNVCYFDTKIAAFEHLKIFEDVNNYCIVSLKTHNRVTR